MKLAMASDSPTGQQGTIGGLAAKTTRRHSRLHPPRGPSRRTQNWASGLLRLVRNDDCAIRSKKDFANSVKKTRGAEIYIYFEQMKHIIPEKIFHKYICKFYNLITILFVDMLRHSTEVCSAGNKHKLLNSSFLKEKGGIKLNLKQVGEIYSSEKSWRAKRLYQNAFETT